MFNWFKKQISSDTTVSAKTNKSDQVPVAIITDNSQYKQQGDVFFKAGKFDEAIGCFQQALNLNQHDAQAHNSLGDIYYEKQMLPQAEASYQRAVELKPDYSDALLNLGLVLDQQGHPAEAEACYRKVVQIRPDNALAHFNLSIVLQAQSRWQEAEKACRMALEINPDFSHAHFNLARLMEQQTKLTEAEASYRTAISINSDFLQARFSLAILLRQQNRLTEAVNSFEDILNRNPNLLEARDALSSVLMALGRYPEAEILCEKTVAQTPENAAAYYNLSFALREQGKLAQTEVALQQAVKLKPDFYEAQLCLGTILLQQDKFAAAEASYRQALAGKENDGIADYKLALLYLRQDRQAEAEQHLQKALSYQVDFVDALSSLSVLLMNQGRYPEAKILLQRLLQLRPDEYTVLFNLALTDYNLGIFSDAAINFKRVTELHPDMLEARINLANSYKKMGQLQDAISNYEQILQRDSNNSIVCNNLAIAYIDQGRITDAVPYYQKALSINPDYAEAYSNLLFALNYHPDMSGADIYQAYQGYDRRYAQIRRSEWFAHSNTPAKGKRLKIGYVSPDMYSHAVKHFLEPLLANHDKKQVEVFAYAQLNWEDAVTARYKNYVDHWIPTKLLSDDELSARIRADGIDILVDLAGHTAENRLQVFACKPAPVSISWLGFGYTTGVSAIDYMLMDDICMPVGCEPVFAEQPWRLSTPSYVYRPAEGMGAVKPLPALQRKYVSFGTFSRAVRINDKVIAVWSAILRRADGARLIIDSSNFHTLAMQQEFIAKFAAHGIEASRLEIGCTSPPWDVMHRIDIGLDCFPHNSGTTLFESLYMGIPFVTLAGRPSMGLLGSSILEGLGHPEWIARTEEEYIEKAVALASNLPALANLRANLREQMQTGALMDETGFTRKVETAYRDMWTKWCERNQVSEQA